MAVLGIDIGTTSLKCVAFDEYFNVIAESRREYPLHNMEGTVEQDPDLWWACAVASVREVTGRSLNVTAVGVSSQGITFVPVDKEGSKLMNAITWLDMRAADECSLIENELGSERIFRITGKRINPAYSLPKLIWLKNKKPEIYDGTYKFLTAHDYIINRMCGVFVTEDSLAAGTMAYDISAKAWDRDILGKTGMDKEKLPEIRSSGSMAGTLTVKAASELGLTTDTRVFTGGQDQKCAAFGAGISSDTATVSLGTSAAITALHEKPILISDKSLPCFPFIDGKSWVLEGFGSTAGASVKWFRDNLTDRKSYSEIDKFIESDYETPGGIMFFPYLGGAGSPEWYEAAGGGFYGIGLGTSETDMARAVLEGSAFTIKANLDKMESAGLKFSKISVFGGGAYSDIWLRIISDVTGKTVVVPKIRETACLGAALLCTGSSNEIEAEKILSPDKSKHEQYLKLYERYKVIEKKIYR